MVWMANGQLTTPPLAGAQRSSDGLRRERPEAVRRTGGVLARIPGFLATLFAIIAWCCVVLALIPLLRDRSERIQVAAEYLAIPIRPNLAYAAFLGLVAGHCGVAPVCRGGCSCRSTLDRHSSGRWSSASRNRPFSLARLFSACC